MPLVHSSNLGISRELATLSFGQRILDVGSFFLAELIRGGRQHVHALKQLGRSVLPLGWPSFHSLQHAGEAR